MKTLPTTNLAIPAKVINFMRLGPIASVLSLALLLVGIVSLGVQQLNFALDFTGGTELRVSFGQPVSPALVRDRLAAAGINGVVKQYGSERDLLIQMRGDASPAVVAAVRDVLTVDGAKPVFNSIDLVGPQIGDELREQGLLAMLVSLILVMVYVSFRFQFKFAFAAVAALVHDVVAVLGVYSLFGWEFDLTVLAAILALIGYSINDTIVIFDRIRENFPKMRSATVVTVVNVALTQTLGRTIITSVTLALVLLAMLIVGGDGLFEFSRALLIGVFFGVYSTIYVASTILVLMKTSAQDLLRPEQDRKQLEEGVV